MYCPKCGNELDIFTDKCLKCGKSFKGMSVSEREKHNSRPIGKKRDKPNSTPVRMTYDNGIPVGEGMSVCGGKQKRGSHRPFLFKY
nr:hypothetical protein [uncultured Methanobrevibacter sp.]